MFLLIICCSLLSFFFFFNDTATTEIYTLSLHDALPIFRHRRRGGDRPRPRPLRALPELQDAPLEQLHHRPDLRSEEHTSELQSPCNLVCRLLLEKKKNKHRTTIHSSITRVNECTISSTM